MTASAKLKMLHALVGVKATKPSTSKSDGLESLPNNVFEIVGNEAVTPLYLLHYKVDADSKLKVL